MIKRKVAKRDTEADEVSVSSPDSSDAESSSIGFVVAPDKSIASNRGTIGPGEPIEAIDVGGEENLQQLILKGFVIGG